MGRFNEVDGRRSGWNTKTEYRIIRLRNLTEVHGVEAWHKGLKRGIALSIKPIVHNGHLRPQKNFVHPIRDPKEGSKGEETQTGHEVRAQANQFQQALRSGLATTAKIISV